MQSNMNEIDNNEKQHSPHDEFFRNVFADVEIARDFLENYLPSPMDVAAIEAHDPSDLSKMIIAFCSQDVK